MSTFLGSWTPSYVGASNSVRLEGGQGKEDGNVTSLDLHGTIFLYLDVGSESSPPMNPAIPSMCDQQLLASPGLGCYGVRTTV